MITWNGWKMRSIVTQITLFVVASNNAELLKLYRSAVSLSGNKSDHTLREWERERKRDRERFFTAENWGTTDPRLMGWWPIGVKDGQGSLIFETLYLQPHPTQNIANNKINKIIVNQTQKESVTVTWNKQVRAKIVILIISIPNALSLKNVFKKLQQF